MKLMTAAQVSEVTGIPLRTVQHMVKTGKMPGAMVAGRYRFQKAELERWIAKHFEAPAPKRRATPLVRKGPGLAPAEW